MKDKQLLKFATSFRKGILGNNSSHSMCAAVCWPLAGLLRAGGVECEAVESDLSEMEDGWLMNHIWIRLPDGRVLDPTADQFNGKGFDSLPPVYLGPPLAIHPTESPKE